MFETVFRKIFEHKDDAREQFRIVYYIMGNFVVDTSHLGLIFLEL